MMRVFEHQPDIQDVKATVDRVGNTLVDVFQLAALFVIGGTIVSLSGACPQTVGWRIPCVR